MIVSVYKPFRSFAWIYQSRSCRSHTFNWIGVYNHSKTPVMEPLFDKLNASGLQLCSKETPAYVFLSELCEIFQHTFFTEYSGQLLLSEKKFNLRINYHSSKRILLEEQLVDISHDLILFYLNVCFNNQNLNLCSAVVLASRNLFIMEIKDWRSLMSACSLACLLK